VTSPFRDEQRSIRHAGDAAAAAHRYLERGLH